MRIKAKNVMLGLHVEEAPAAQPADESAVANGGLSAPPYRLVSGVGDGPAGMPPVLATSNAQLQQAGKAPQPQPVQPPFDPLQQLALLLRQDTAAGLAENGAAQQAGSLPQPVATGSGRPVRKRKTTTFSDDMIPTEVLKRRSRAKVPAQPQPPPPPPALRPPPPPPPQMAPVQPSMAAALAAAAAAAPSAAAGTAIQLVTMPAPGGGTMTGLAVPAAVLLAMQQQLMRAQGGAAAGGLPAASAVPVPVPLMGPMPYRLVPAVQPAPGSQPAVPAVRTAAPRDIVQLAKQLDEEERRRALAASDARVVLRVVPASQAAGKGAKEPAASQSTRGRGGSTRGASEDSAGVRGRGRSGGRQPRKPTPDLAERRLDLPPGTWHPGFEAFGGVTHVDAVQAPAAPRLPAVVVGTPPRFSQPLAHDPRAEFDFSEDPLRSSLEYLRQAARTAGRLTHYGGAVQTAVNAEQRLYCERLGRAHYARDGRSFTRQHVKGTRKSVRMRAAPEVLMPPPPPPAGQQRGGRGAKPPRQAAKPEDDTDVRRGAEYQAELPAVRPRPAQPTEEEARWVTGLACRPGAAPPPRYDAQQTAAMPAASAQERAAWVSSAHSQLRAALGEERCAAMGLLAMGADACAGLLSEEEAGLEAGMRELGRAFHAIHLEHVPTRTQYQLQSHYYNVWKLRATPRSRAWYERKGIEVAARQAEVERAERAAAAEQETQKQRQEQRYKRRMLREVVQWVKGAARAPTEVHNRPVVVQRAQRAAKLIGGLNAVAAGK